MPDVFAGGASRQRSGLKIWVPEGGAEQRGRGKMNFGNKIRFTRRLRGLTLKEVAEAADCSESLLSKIENGHADPSLKTLQRLAVALGMSISQLFTEDSDEDLAVMSAAKRISFDAPQLGRGSRIEPLAPNAENQMLECRLLLLGADAAAPSAATQEGEQFGYVLEGEIELTVDGAPQRAVAGDSFHFRSERPHSWKILGGQDAKIIWITTPPKN
ncbi:helix-turn-helix domain-containing protein [Methyloligella solikamskensis]|uniref:Helix-turn-helix domain-containing protein n=1 Tax=Methyloligella solikamskensis TaxID=1177756 RepID=A0ABW3J742_9HYPH